jgi:hypothetical protein
LRAACSSVTQSPARETASPPQRTASPLLPTPGTPGSGGLVVPLGKSGPVPWIPRG